MTPQSVFVRTLLSGLAGVAVAAAAIDWTQDWRPQLVTMGIALLVVVIASVAAWALAQSRLHADTPLGKALGQFLQLAGAGLAAVVINVPADIVPQGKLVITVLVSAVFSAVGTLALNAVGQSAGE